MEIPASKTSPPVFPSIHDAKPLEKGGPVARAGFSYQDEIAVSLLLDMLENKAISCVQCETQDDAVVIWVGASEIVEHVQVKSNESDAGWTLPALTYRSSNKVGSSIFETSLSRDRLKEASIFRIVTLRHVSADLRPLTFERGKPGREAGNPNIAALLTALKKRCPEAISAKKNGADYWLENCHWDVRESGRAVARHNLLRVIQLSAAAGHPLLPESAQTLLTELRQRAKAAGEAKWEPDRDKKIFNRADLLAWWNERLIEVTEGVAVTSGGKLRGKMTEAGVSQSLILLAVEIRRMYAAEARAPRYMEPDTIEPLQWRVKSAIASLQSQHDAGELDALSDAQFHDLCLLSMDKISASMSANGDDHSAFLKGCMYDIADRCLLRFTRAKS